MVLKLLVLVSLAIFGFGQELPPVKVVPAAQVVEVPNIQIYEKSAKILFIVDLRDTLKHVRRDISEMFSANETLLDLLKDDITENILQSSHSRWLNPESKFRQKRQVVAALMFAGGYFSHSIFSTISRQLFGTDSDVKQYVNKLRQSVGEVEREFLVTEAKIKHFAEQVDKVLNFTMAKTDEKFKEVHELIRVKLLRDWFIESVQSCQARNIPMKFVPPEKLHNELTKLNQLLEKNNITMAIPPEKMWEMFKIPVTDCIFTETRVVVTVNVPIRKKGNDWKLFEIQHTKFAFEGQTCAIYPQDAHYLARTSEKAVVITPSMIPQCVVPQHTLCLVPQYTRDSSESLACAIGLLEGKSIAALRNVCAFRCTANQELVIQEHADGAMTLTNVESLKISCPWGTKQYGFKKTGAVFVKLSCGCSMIANNDYNIEAPLFCTFNGKSDMTVVRVTPNLWSRLDNAVGLSEQFFSDHSNDTLFSQWPKFVPVLNLSAPAFTPLPDPYFYEGATFTHIWLGVLTAVVCILCIFVCILFVAVR